VQTFGNQDPDTAPSNLALDWSRSPSAERSLIHDSPVSPQLLRTSSNTVSKTISLRKESAGRVSYTAKMSTPERSMRTGTIRLSMG
jgi:hypothetical protein